MSVLPSWTVASDIFCTMHKMYFICTVHFPLPSSSAIGTNGLGPMANRLERLTDFKLASHLHFRFSFLACALNLVITKLGKEERKQRKGKQQVSLRSYFSPVWPKKIFPVCGNKICAARVPERQSPVLWILIEIEWQWNLHRKWRI